MKKLFILIGLFIAVHAQAGTIRLIRVEPAPGVYHLTIYGRLDYGTVEKIDIKDPLELSKFTAGLETQAELGLSGKNVLRYDIGYCDGDFKHDNFDAQGNYVSTTVDKVSGSLSYISVQYADPAARSLVVSKSDPQIKATKDAITDVKTLVDSK